MATEQKKDQSDLEWEIVSEPLMQSFHKSLFRARVPGGWFVERRCSVNGISTPVSMFFYSDPNGAWKLNPKKDKA